MKKGHLPKTSGIYWIVNIQNGKMYIGSAVNIQRRVYLHRRDLVKNSHYNPKLQRAWNKYGAAAFEASVLELVSDTEILLTREQHWIDLVNPCKNGYNIAPRAGSQLGFVHSEESLLKSSITKSKPIAGFISPDGEQVTIQNMRSFCKERGLTTAAMYMMTRGRATSHKGWTHVNAKPKDREWINTYDGFVDPEGNQVGPITNLEQFSIEHGLNPSAMNKVYRGVKPSHHGWTHVDSVNKRNEPKHWTEYPGWVSPEGEEITITNMAAFCREHNLDQPSMWKIMQGKYPQHKGWRYPAGGYQPKQRETQTWHGYVSPDGEQVVIENLFRFSKENGLSEAHMGRLRTGERKTHKGWTYNPDLERESTP